MRNWIYWWCQFQYWSRFQWRNRLQVGIGSDCGSLGQFQTQIPIPLKIGITPPLKWIVWSPLTGSDEIRSRTSISLAHSPQMLKIEMPKRKWRSETLLPGVNFYRRIWSKLAKFDPLKQYLKSGDFRPDKINCISLLHPSTWTFCNFWADLVKFSP